MSQKDNDKAKKFSSSIPADAGAINSTTVKYRPDCSLTNEQRLYARELRLPPNEYSFEQIAHELNVPVEQIEIALNNMRTSNEDPKRGTLNVDLYSWEVMQRKSKELGMPIFKIQQLLLQEASWVRSVD